MAADNALVTPMVRTFNQAVGVRTQNKFQQSPQQIPANIVSASGGTVTVAAQIQGAWTIPQTQYPRAGVSEYTRPPVVAGDKGFLTSADYYLGGQSGLGGGEANFVGRANLTNMVWIPVSPKTFTTSPNVSNKTHYIAGPDGAIMQDSGGKVVVQIDVPNKKVIINITDVTYTGYLGGDGVTGSYDFVQTMSGPSMNFKARYA